MHIKHTTLVTSLLFAGLATWAQADEPVLEEDLAQAYGDQTTITIATGSQQSLRRAPSVASVITAADIEAMGATDLDTVLKAVPGLHVSRSANSYSPLYVIRGVNSLLNPQTLMLQNGIPMTILFTGNRGNIWGKLPIENIARIEVIRGPGSALYGADAYSGVINIVTKTAAESEGTQVGVRLGSFSSQDAWVLHGGQVGPISVAAYLHAGKTDGSKEVIDSDAQTRNDAAFGTKVSRAPGTINVDYKAVDASLDLSYGKWRWRSGYKLRDDVGTGAGITSALDPTGKTQSRRMNSDLSWLDAQVLPNTGAGFSASYLYYRQTIPSPLILYPAGMRFPSGLFPDGMIGSPEFWERQIRFSGFLTYNGWVGHALRFGMGHDSVDLYRIRELKNFTFTASGLPVPAGPVKDYTNIAPYLLPQKRTVNYAYVQDEWTLAKDWALTAGVRHDRYNDFGSTTNPRLALVWDARYNLTAKLLYGRAFRAPSFGEFYSANNPTIRGNINLKPETVRTTEAAVAWQPRRDVHLNLSAYRYDARDLIRTSPNAVAGTGLTYNNIGQQTGRGLELEAAWDVARDLKLAFNYARQRTIDKLTNKDAGNAPHHLAYGSAEWRIDDGWLLSSQISRVAGRKRVAGDTRTPVADYTNVDVAITSKQGKGKWDLTLAIGNLFDADIREPSVSPGLIAKDLPQPGRNWMLQASYRM
ncbi:TonB-dependent receptor [Chitinimonas viridis]|uniref:TonB-dependent receptor n=1 Tax=Chitinimonas viridis TaxID=664880 RepID=A0ABT8B100_9NEIS|nr:TonB-dependent receptor [Chitinimonas viridis]MDN3575381.1 TonB-dependent receptor [Chitinimonas viridis]